jgi:class 3 adenylate cyclase
MGAVEPRIQYAKTADGVSIAFWTLGEGMPLVAMPSFPYSQIQLEWHIPKCRHWYERLAEKSKLVRYDSRGTGLSDRRVTEFSLDSLGSDLQAVVDRLGLEKFALLAQGNSGPAAIAYAAHHPERVSHLVFWCSWARGRDVWPSPQYQAFRALRGKDWQLYTETVAHVYVGWSDAEEAAAVAALMRESVTPQAAWARQIAVQGFDATDLLPQLKAPTLVLHRRQLAVFDIAVARGLASRIPDARLGLLEGASGAPWVGDMEALAKIIDEFLGKGEDAVAAAEPSAPRAVHTILFTDVEGSTSLTQRLGDAKAQELIRTHNAIVRDALKACSGSEIKHTGDGIMASFPYASQALQCAISTQKAVAALEDVPLRVRIGLNAGEPVAEEHDLFGTAVQLARRVCDHADPGQILVSNVVRELAAGKGFLFSDHGDVDLRGFEDPVRLYEVRWQEDA